MIKLSLWINIFFQNPLILYKQNNLVIQIGTFEKEDTFLIFIKKVKGIEFERKRIEFITEEDKDYKFKIKATPKDKFLSFKVEFWSTRAFRRRAKMWEPGGWGKRFNYYITSPFNDTLFPPSEIQKRKPPIFSFNPYSLKFEKEIFKIDTKRAQKNIEIIEKIKSIIEFISDSSALLLYRDVNKTFFPPKISKFEDKVKYLLKNGWLKALKNKKRKELIYEISKENKELLKMKMQTIKEKERIRKILLYTPFTLLLLFFLFLLYKYFLSIRKSQKEITSKKTDRLIAIGVIVYTIFMVFLVFSPYLITPAFKAKIENSKFLITKKVLKFILEFKIKKVLKKDFPDYEFHFHNFYKYRDRLFIDVEFTKRGKIQFSFHKTIRLRKDEISYKKNEFKIIEKFEKDERIKEFCREHKIKFAKVKYDEIEAFDADKKYFITFKNGEITSYKAKADFESYLFPEIIIINYFCRKRGLFPSEIWYLGDEFGEIKKFKVSLKGFKDFMEVKIRKRKITEYVFKGERLKLKDINNLKTILNKILLKNLNFSFKENLILKNFYIEKKPDLFNEIYDRYKVKMIYRINTGKWIDDRLELKFEFYFFKDSLKIRNLKVNGEEFDIYKKIQFNFNEILDYKNLREILFKELPSQKIYKRIFPEFSVLKRKFFLVGIYSTHKFRVKVMVDVFTGEVNIEKEKIVIIY